MLRKRLQLNSYKNLWRKGFPQYGNWFVIFSTIWRVQYKFSTLGNSQYIFSTTQKLWFKIFHKIGSNFFCSTMCKCFSTEYCIQLIWIPLNDKYCTFVMQKMSKIPHNDNMACKKCGKSRFFCGRILARILRPRKFYEVFHVWNSRTRNLLKGVVLKRIEAKRYMNPKFIYTFVTLYWNIYLLTNSLMNHFHCAKLAWFLNT